MKIAIFSVLSAFTAFGQKPDAKITFEAASVKMGPQRPLQRAGLALGRCQGCPGSSDPIQFTCNNVTVECLVTQAFDLRLYQFPSGGCGPKLGGGPGPGQWVAHAGIDVQAKVPPGATREQLRTMLQNLLIERFKLAYHFEKREADLFDLVVAKSGLKMKESPAGSPLSDEDLARGASGPPGKPPAGPKGCPDFEIESGVAMVTSPGPLYCFQGVDAPIAGIVSFLSGASGHELNDATGLKGRFSFTLGFARSTAAFAAGLSAAGGDELSSAADPAPPFLTALQDQLGLTIQKRRASMDFLVIDRVEKVPTEN